MLNLPPVHGYGIPQILSQWQAGQDRRENQKRYETELAFKKKESARAEKQFDMQMETHKANIENIQSAQRIAIGDQGFKLADYADKLAEDPSKAPMANEIRKQAYGRWEKAFGITFDVEAINKLNGLSLQAKEEESQILNGIQKGLDAGRNGDIKSLYKVNDALTAIENNKKLKPNIIVALREQVKTAMDNIPKPEKTDGDSDTTDIKNFKFALDNPEFKKQLDSKKQFSPSEQGKLVEERNALIEKGYPEDHPDILAYNRKISGDDIEIAEMTEEEISVHASNWILTGKMIPFGRGKQSTKIRARIAKKAAEIALEGTGIDPGRKTPMEAALSVVSSQADTKSIQTSLNFLEKQIGTMGSFTANMDLQINRITELSQGLKTFDTRLLNIPLRAVRGKIIGTPLQSQYDLLLAEIEREAAKLATGSTASVAELSATAQNRFDELHDKNLAVKDMLKVLQETSHLAKMRYKSVNDQLARTRKKLKTREYPQNAPGDDGTIQDLSKLTDEEILESLYAN
jgi:hypothetical protein